MSAELAQEVRNKYVTVDGLKLRYIEEGEGPAVLLLHGASLGSSADVFRRNLPPLARAGFRAIAFDQPGFGLSDVPSDHSAAFRKKTMPKFADALGLKKVALVGHSQAGNPAVQLALETPERYSHVVVLGTGSLLPPIDTGKSDRGGEAQHRLERRMAQSEPTIEHTRKLLQENLYHQELITPEELSLRHSQSVGRNFAAFVARTHAAEAAPPKPDSKPPLWQRLVDLRMPLLMIFGRNDRAHAADRAAMLKDKYPQLQIHIVDGCKHLVPWDAADAFIRLAVPFLKG
ncbi:MAG: alpha/beta fold hydrolase [Alphaproteobacteria bacterium]|nr:alpha/beta fold hydrolase [Alphaproteobacteria bacterium]